MADEDRTITGIRVTGKGHAVLSWCHWLEDAHPDEYASFGPYAEDQADHGFVSWWAAGGDPRRMAEYFRRSLRDD